MMLLIGIERLAMGVVVAVISLLGLMTPAPAVAVPELPIASYTYDTPPRGESTNYAAEERGPPGVGAKAEVQAGQRVVGAGLRGAATSSGLESASHAYAYDAPAPIVPANPRTGTTTEQAGGSRGRLASLSLTGVAANSSGRAIDIRYPDGTYRKVHIE